MKKEQLIRELIEEKWLATRSVIEAFKKVPREDFIPAEQKRFAYVNTSLPIAAGQTISQPLTVAVMTESLAARPGDKVLEIGAGSGYQAALLSEIVGPTGKIITTEIISELFEFAKKNLSDYKNVTVLNIDGSLGCEKYAPYDRIIVTASAPRIPGLLIEQLKDNGRLVIPVGDKMIIIEKQNGEIKETFLGYYAFVPLRGEHGYKSL